MALDVVVSEDNGGFLDIFHLNIDQGHGPSMITYL